MQFSAGRSELNPYIAVVLGLLSLAVYVAASTTTLPKLAAETQSVVRQDIQRESPTSIRESASPLTRGPSVASTIRPSTIALNTSQTFQPTSAPASAPAPASSSPFTRTLTSRKPFTAPSTQTSPATTSSLTSAPPITSVGPTVTRQFGGSELDTQSSEAPPAEYAGRSNTEDSETKSSFSFGAPAMRTTAAVTGAGLSMASASTDTIGSSIVWTLISILIGVVVFFGLLALLARLGGVDIRAAIQRGLSNDRSLYDVTISQDSVKPEPAPYVPSEPVESNEVFQVGNGNLTYIEARGACQAQGAKLASYSQIEDAYKNGGEWCSYGWSEGQLALFPTQKETYEKLQEGCSGDQNACGRPGVNGGYIANPNVRFAANCYGVKPKPTKEEEREVRNKIVSPQDSEANRIAQLYKSADKQFKIRPFAPGEWSEEEATTSNN